MWPWTKRGSPTENELLREQNDLLRRLIRQSGNGDVPPMRSARPVKRRTEHDIVVVTREMHRDQQERQREADRLRALNDLFGDRVPSSDGPLTP